MLSHEVNNSIGAANSLLHSALTYTSQIQTSDRFDFETAISVAISRTDHLNSFMKSFADILRLPQPRREPVDVVGLVTEISASLRSRSAEWSIRWEWVREGELGHLLMDKDQMERAFLNILKNSIEAIGPRGGVNTMRSGKRDGRAFMTIEDTGCGIAQEVQSQLFTPLFSTKEEGQGIGLTLVQEILSRHRFEFSLESNTGSPTIFTIFFS